MQAYEFNTIVHQNMIFLPEECQDKQLSSVRVIILANSLDIPIEKRKVFNAMRLKTKGFKFNREEANEK